MAIAPYGPRQRLGPGSRFARPGHEARPRVPAEVSLKGVYARLRRAVANEEPGPRRCRKTSVPLAVAEEAAAGVDQLLGVLADAAAVLGHDGEPLLPPVAIGGGDLGDRVQAGELG